ncbi:MAG: aminotransferase class V-fold PLP-dependent enzyme [Bacteroidetes bacterium]|nr:MAG: aminotransferase class V-fold PLP-dependent enzyme [Bacteroidota bacterium]
MKTESKELLNEIHSSQFGMNYMLPGPFGDRFITYSDYIASGQPLRFLESYLQNVVLPTYANTHTESSFTGMQTSKYREEARQMIKESVNASDEDVLIFAGSGSTGAFDLMVRKLNQHFKDQEKPIVFIGPYEHHSNVLPWREGNFELIEVPISEKGNVDLNFLKDQLEKHKGKKMIGSFSAGSNVTGIKAPVEEITSLLKEYDAWSFWDYAGAAPYVKIDMNPANGAKKDALFISSHKLVGGPGSPGVLVVKKNLFESDLPVVLGGGTVHFVTKSQQRYFEDIETREEGGTPSIIGAIRAGLAFRLKDKVGAELIEEIEEGYIHRAIERFSKEPNIYVLGNLEQPRLGFMAFHIRYEGRFLHHNFVVALLNDLFGIQARGGCSCAGPYGHDLLNLSEEKSQQYMVELAKGNVGSKPGWVRLNFNYFIPEEEFNYILDAMCWIANNGWKLLNEYHFDDDNALWSFHGQHMKANSLYSFLGNEPKLKQGKARKKKKLRKQYFLEADKIANAALEKMKTSKLQEYKHDQVENPLRWYSLSQDVPAAL